MTTRDLVISALAIWRLSHLLVHENGPFEVVKRLRTLVGVTEIIPANGAPRRSAESTIGLLFLCPLCLSVWVAPAVLAVVRHWPLRPIVYALALSGASSLLELEVSRR